MSNLGELDMEKEKKMLLNVMFEQRCIRCKGFVFLVHSRKISNNKFYGLIICPDCKTENKSSFYINRSVAIKKESPVKLS